MTKEEAFDKNPAVLAYVGDAVYELFVRRSLAESGQIHPGAMSRAAVACVRAEGQALAIKKLLDSLTQEEQTLVRRARNKKVTSTPRSVDIRAYKWATAFEALVGYLYLSGQEKRGIELMAKAVCIIQEGKEQKEETV